MHTKDTLGLIGQELEGGDREEVESLSRNGRQRLYLMQSLRYSICAEPRPY
jgi:hypothetical protein